jgi:riboflavin synthase
MFTGIIESIGVVKRSRKSGEGVTFTVECPGIAGGLAPGDSVAVNGACQTVEKIERSGFTFTTVGESLRKTTLSKLRPGSPVNLEQAATLDKALGGHLVQGHVDGVGTVSSFMKRAQDWILSVRLPDDLFKQIVAKGSIAIDGMSLTVMAVTRGGIVQVTIIPFTREHSIIKHYRSGTEVNIETDIIGKYVFSYLNQSIDTGSKE